MRITAEQLKLLQKTSSVAEIRTVFASARMTRFEACELSLAMGYTPFGIKSQVMARLQSNVEAIVMSMGRMKTILS